MEMFPMYPGCFAKYAVAIDKLTKLRHFTIPFSTVPLHLTPTTIARLESVHFLDVKPQDSWEVRSLVVVSALDWTSVQASQGIITRG